MLAVGAVGIAGVAVSLTVHKWRLQGSHEEPEPGPPPDPDALRIAREQKRMQEQSAAVKTFLRWRFYTLMFVEMGEELGTFNSRTMCDAAKKCSVTQRPTLTRDDWLTVTNLLVEAGLLAKRQGRHGGTFPVEGVNLRREIQRRDLPYPNEPPPVPAPQWYRPNFASVTSVTSVTEH